MFQKGLRDSRVPIHGYYPLSNRRLYKKYIEKKPYTSKDMLLIVSNRPRDKYKPHLTFIDMLYLPLSYRYHIKNRDKIIYLNLYMYLYKR